MILTSKEHNTVHKGAVRACFKLGQLLKTEVSRDMRMLLTLQGTTTMMCTHANQWHIFFGCTSGSQLASLENWC